MPEDIIISLNAATTGTGAVLSLHGYDRYAWSVVPSGTISGGAVALEWAETAGYSGTWKNIASISPATTTQDGSSGDALGIFIRARITSNITGGGNITVYLKRSTLSNG